MIAKINYYLLFACCLVCNFECYAWEDNLNLDTAKARRSKVNATEESNLRYETIGGMRILHCPASPSKPSSPRLNRYYKISNKQNRQSYCRVHTEHDSCYFVYDLPDGSSKLIRATTSDKLRLKRTRSTQLSYK